jgi:toxin YoeB
MKRGIIFEGDTWERYEALRTSHPQLFRNLCRLLREMQREDPAKGSGKPEPLKHTLQGLWSRRLSQSDRLIYSFTATHVSILAIGGHYDT